MIKFFFKWFWEKRLFHYTGKPYKLIYIKGWRTCIVDSPGGQRAIITFLFKIGKYYV